MSRVLIVEDDIFLGDVLLQKLKSGGYETRLSRDGASGLKEIHDWKPDLILLDIILPEMNGYEVLEAKQKDPSIRSIPVIVVSNSGQPVEINRALALGVRDYLVKAQFDPEEVLSKVRTLLGQDESSNGSGKKKSEPTEKGAATAPAAGASVLKGRKIMWVEDDSFLSDLIARKLSSLGCALVHAPGGEEAETLLKTETPELILLDIILPKMDGFELLKRLKANQKLKSIPVILLSNLGQREEVEKGKLLGAARYLIKATVTLDEIVEEIKAVLKYNG